MNTFQKIFRSPSPYSWLIVGGWIFLLTFLISPGSAQAQTNPETGITMSVVAGLDGYCKYDRWMPVRVTLENTGADLDGRIVAQVADGLNQWRYAQSVALPAVSRKEVTLFARIPGGANLVTVSFLSDNKVVTQETKNISCLQANSILMGVWASTPSVYNIFTTLSFSGGRTAVAVLDQADYPIHSEGLQMLDMMVISDVDTGILSEAQQRAITSWVEEGGRLIVAGGPGWQKTASGLEDLLPIQVTGSTTFSNLQSLEWFSPESEPLTGETVVTTGAVRPSALILASQDKVPLILQHNIGFGDVFFLAVDPALAPLRNWTGIEQMYQHIFATPLDIPTWADGFTSWYEASSAVSNVPGLGLPSIFLICGFLGLYIVALGPVNYLVLRQLKRRELAWLSIPALVILFSAAAFILGLFARGSRPVINHLAIVQVWPGREQASIHGLVGVFSPNRSLYNVQVNGNYLSHPILDGSLGGAPSWDITQKDNAVSIEDLRIDAGGLEGIVVHGITQAPEFASNLILSFGASGNSIDGEVKNNSSISLRDVVLLGPGSSQSLGNFDTGDSLNIHLPLSGSSAATPNSNTSGYPYYSYGYDSTLQDVFGTTYVNSSNFDQDTVRRFNLLQAALGYGGTRGGGIYLVGWTDTSPLDVSLDGKGFKAEHTSLYIIALEPTFQNSTSTLTLPPAMFTWDRLENSTNLDFSPYNSYFYAGTYQIRYRLSQAIPYQAVRSLTMHLEDFGAQGPHRMNIALWDFAAEGWVSIAATDWGDFSIPDPANYVGFGGEIRLQIENPIQTSVEFERVDFTLVVEQ